MLEIAHNEINFGDESIRNLKHVLKFGTLMYLDISYNNIGD